MTIPQPPGYPAAPPQTPGYPPNGQPQQYQTIQYQPPAGPQQPAPGQFGGPPQPGQAPQQVMPATVPSDQLPGWGEMMGSGGAGLSTKDANGNWITGVWQGGIVLNVLPARHRTAPREQGGAPLYFTNGDPKVAYPVSLLTNDRDPANPNDTGVRTDFIQSTAIKAVKTELAKHNVTQPEIGGVLYRMLLRAGGPGGTAKSHEWVYSYTPPTAETLAIAQQHNAPPVQATPPPSVAAPTYTAPPAAAPAPAPAAPQYAPTPQFAQTAAQYGVGPAAPQTVPGAPYVPQEQPSTAAAAAQAPGQPGQPSAWPYGQPAAPQGQPAPAQPGVPAPPQFPTGG